MLHKQKEILLKDLHKYIFNFFTAKELKNNCLISHNWKEVTEELIKKTHDQIFYTVGESIYIADVPITSAMPSFKRRKVISDNELTQAFPRKEAKLFIDERIALAYARSQQSNDSTQDDRLYQPAIYKVQYLGNIPESKTEVIKIKSYMQLNICEISMQFFIVKNELLLPHHAQVKVNFKECPHRGLNPLMRQEFYEYPPLNFNLPMRKNLSCSIL